MSVVKITLDINKFPELLYLMQQALARKLRYRAEAEADPRVVRALQAVADEFEVGQ